MQEKGQTEVCLWLNFGCIWDEAQGCHQFEHKCLVFHDCLSKYSYKGSVDVSSRIILPAVTLFFQNWTQTGSPALYSQQCSSPTQICSPGYASVSLKRKNQHNRMSKVLYKTLWSLFYRNYNNVILNHMARVMWCKDFSTFLTFSHPKRVWKGKAVISF